MVPSWVKAPICAVEGIVSRLLCGSGIETSFFSQFGYAAHIFFKCVGLGSRLCYVSSLNNVPGINTIFFQPISLAQLEFEYLYWPFKFIRSFFKSSSSLANVN